jgi:hypothetical protein
MLSEENARIKLQGVVLHPWCLSFEKVFKEERMKIVEKINKKIEKERTSYNKQDLISKNNPSANNSNNVSLISDNGKSKSFISNFSNENSRLQEDANKYRLINEKLNSKGKKNNYKFFSKAEFDSLLDDKELEKNNFDTFNSNYANAENNLKNLTNFDTFDNKFFVNPNISYNSNAIENKLSNSNNNLKINENIEKLSKKSIEIVEKNNKSAISCNSSINTYKMPNKTEENLPVKEIISREDSFTQNSLFNLNTPNNPDDPIMCRDRSKSRLDLPSLMTNRQTNSLFDKVLDQIKSKGKPKNKKHGKNESNSIGNKNDSSSFNNTNTQIDQINLLLTEISKNNDMEKKLDKIKKEKEKNGVESKQANLIIENTKIIDTNPILTKPKGKFSNSRVIDEKNEEIKFNDEIVTAFFDVDERDNSIINSFNLLKKSDKDHLYSGESRLNKEYDSLSSKKTGFSKNNENKYNKELKNTE